RVHLYGRHAEKMRLVEPLGVLSNDAGNIPSGTSYPFVVEATGSSAGLEQAVAITRPRGTLVMKSTVHDRISIDTAPIIVNELTMVGSRCGRFEPALELLEGGRLILEPLIQERYALRDAVQAFARAAQPGVAKVLLDS
ncbi:MAG: zinc-binding dehydrogenase, partial [Bryobacterales bacterium]|nr:zinc-binding dehydrogenase [Bryobacterales bacterium]